MAFSEKIDAQTRLEALHRELSRCSRCAAAGYFIGSRPVFSGPASAEVMVVGQAPAKVEAGQSGVPFGLRRSGRRSRLWDWLEQAGWPEERFRSGHYLSAITKCYPGKNENGRGDRVPTATERELCRPWRERELELIRPKIILPVGRLAIETFLPELKGQPLSSFVGQLFEREGVALLPLPHPSGVSRWLNSAQNRARVDEALARLRALKKQWDIG